MRTSRLIGSTVLLWLGSACMASAAPAAAPTADPTNDPLGKGFHIIQSTIAVGSGGMQAKVEAAPYWAVSDAFDGTERAVHRIQYGARMKVDDGDKVKRGQRPA